MPHHKSFSMEKKNIDIVNDVLEECIIAYPVSSFIISLYKQYTERGWLSKKQLQGLHGKAAAIPGISPGKVATIESMINQMPNRYKTEAPPVTPLYQKDDQVGEMIEAILAKYPQHKRILFFKSKFENNEVFTVPEINDLKRLHDLVK